MMTKARCWSIVLCGIALMGAGTVDGKWVHKVIKEREEMPDVFVTKFCFAAEGMPYGSLMGPQRISSAFAKKTGVLACAWTIAVRRTLTVRQARAACP